jgi:hypothetical protein
MLYVTGDRVDRSAEPATVVAELYRAHAIENYDTAALRITTGDGVELLFVVSHATATRVDPTFSFEFERGTVEFAGTPDGRITARMTDGTTRDYGSPNDRRDGKLIMTIDGIRSGQPTVCGIEASAAHTRCALAAQASMPDITPFPRDLVRVTGDVGQRKTAVDSLDDAIKQCYATWRLPSEVGVTWARPGKLVQVPALPESVSPKPSSGIRRASHAPTRAD